MIEFMVLGASRSGTTWAANWLTTDTTLCLHDPLWQHHYKQLDMIAVGAGKSLGVSCTGLINFSGWVNKHPARKVILHRPKEEIAASLCAMGLPDPDDTHLLPQIRGLHVDYTDLFDPVKAKYLYEFLMQRPFDSERHAQLVAMHIQPKLDKLSPDPTITHQLLNELRGL